MAIPTKKISELTVLSSVQATDKVPIGRPSSSSGNSITLATLAAFVENITKSNAASSSNDSPSPNALATMAAVIEKKTVTIDTWPENPDKAVTYLAATGTYEAIGDNGEDIEVPTGCQATLNWDAETDCWLMGTPIPVGTTGSGGGGNIDLAQTLDPEATDEVPSSKAVAEYVAEFGGKANAIRMKRGWLTNLTPVSSITNQSNASKSIFGTFRYGNLQTSDELAGYALCTRNYITAQGTLTLGNVSDLIVDVFEYDSSKALIKISRYATPLTLDANTRFIKVRALKSSSEDISLEPGRFNVADITPAADNSYVRFITTDADDFAPNIAYEIGADNLGAGDVVSAFFGGKLIGKAPLTCQKNIVGDAIISADTVNNIALRDENYPDRGVPEKYGIELSVYTDGTQSDDVRSYNFTLKKHTLLEVDEREIVIASNVYPVIVKHDYFPSYPFLDGESGTNDKNFVFPFDWNGVHYLSKIILKLPKNYSTDGDGVPVVAFRRGSFSFEGKVDPSKTNTGMNSVVAFGEGTADANYEPVAGYIKDEGFAVFDFHPNGTRWNGYDGYGTPLNLHVLKCAYEWLEEVFNISHEQRFFMSKSNGGMISSVIPFHPELGIKAVAQLAPNCDTPKTMYNQINNQAKAVAALQDLGFSDTDALAIISDVFAKSDKKQAFKQYILANMAKFAGYLQQYDGNITPTDFSTIYDLTTNVTTGWDDVKRKCSVRVKTWCAQDDDNVSYNICRNYIHTLQAGGSYAVLRTMPYDTGKHHSVDTSQLAPKSSGVTRLGIAYTDIADAVIEVVQWFLGNNYEIVHPVEE